MTHLCMKIDCFAKNIEKIFGVSDKMPTFALG